MKHKKKAFTLLEMIIVLAISGIVLGIVGSIFITGNKVFSDSDVKTTLQMEAKDIQEKLSKICMEANEEPIINGGEITFIDENEQKTIINNNSNSLSILIKDKDDNEISRKTLSKNIKFFSFECSNNLFKITLELDNNKGFSKNNSYKLDFIITPRNIS